MINVVVPGLVLSALLAAPAALPELPDETVVLELRRARIAEQLGDRDGRRRILDELLATHPADPTALAAALAYYRELDPGSETARTLRGRLVESLEQPGRTAPTRLLQDVATDPKAASDDLTRLLGLLDAQPGTGSDRVERMRLRAGVLDRLGRKEELLIALNELVAVDSDPGVARRLLSGYREAGRWDDVLRAAARIAATQTSAETGWWRLEALRALGRTDEMVTEADALLGRIRARAGPGLDLATGPVRLVAPTVPSPKPAGLPPYTVQGFLPYVFALYDAGRRDAAERLLTELEAASPDLDAAQRIRVMLFGSPDDRIAFLASVAGASMASGDPDKIRAEAYQRLLAKDYGTAHDLYRRLQELEPNASTWGSGDWFNYGLASIETEAWADAEMAMTNAIATGAAKPRALAHRARARIMLGRIAEGIADAEAALAEEPKLRQACYAMYLGYQKLGHQEKADEWLKRSKAP